MRDQYSVSAVKRTWSKKPTFLTTAWAKKFDAGLGWTNRLCQRRKSSVPSAPMRSQQEREATRCGFSRMIRTCVPIRCGCAQSSESWQVT